jgi:hypothetical protein
MMQKMNLGKLGKTLIQHEKNAWIACTVIVCLTVLFFAINFRASSHSDRLHDLTPWRCVGGCGAGGAGGTAADIKWIGQGVRGGLIDAEVISSLTLGQSFEYKQVKTRLSMKPTWSMNVGMTIPVVSKMGMLQPKTNFDDKTETTGGLADLMFDISKTMGMEGEYAVSLNLVVPTGQYDVKRSKENGMLYLPTTLQRGGGVYNAVLGLSRTIDVDRGLWIVEGFFSYPFALNFHGKNQFINNQPDQFNDVAGRWDLLTDEQKKRFEYYFKPYGENDLGGYTPPSITATIFYGNRRQANYVHSYGAKLWFPLGVAWAPFYSAGSYNPMPDPSHKSWSVTLHYGLEFSRAEYPIYFAINKTIWGKSTPNQSNPYDEKTLAWLHAPDIKELLNDNWTFALGVKATMF